MSECAVCSREAVVMVSVQFTTLDEPRCDRHAQRDHPRVQIEQRLAPQY